MEHGRGKVLGDDSGVTGVRIRNTETDEVSDVVCKGYFSAIGHKPNTEVFADALETDEVGYLVADGVKTSILGIYAAGDVRSHLSSGCYGSGYGMCSGIGSRAIFRGSIALNV